MNQPKNIPLIKDSFIEGLKSILMEQKREFIKYRRLWKLRAKFTLVFYAGAMIAALLPHIREWGLLSTSLYTVAVVVFSVSWYNFGEAKA
jgi:hypothetical protein